jgi:DUF4097 and DUF4098 domain-containing protein YvlB
MSTLTSAILLAGILTAPQQADTTIIVAATERLEVQTAGGEIIVDTWDRNEVRIVAEYGSRDELRVSTSGAVLRVRSESSRGLAIIDYRITVPPAMDLELVGMHADISVDGSQGQVGARTVNGDITVIGGGGQVEVETVQGDVVVEGARASVRARSVSGQVRLRDISGPIDAQTVSGSVVMLGIESNQVEATAVSGGIFYDGPIRDNGRYSFVSHSGSVTLALPEAPNATVSVAVLSGSIRSSFPGMVGSTDGRGRRQSFTVGSGSASVEIESFSGSVRLVRRGEVDPPGGGNRGSI